MFYGFAFLQCLIINFKNLKMELSSVLIVAILMATSIVVYVIVRRSRLNREKNILQSITDLANQHHCKIDQYEFYNDFLIGIDESKNFVFFQKKSNDKNEDQFVNLADVQACKIVNMGRTVNNKAGNYNVVDRLLLIFVPIAKNGTEVQFEFYNAEVSMQLSKELQIIEKWQLIIDERLKRKKQ